MDNKEYIIASVLIVAILGLAGFIIERLQNPCVKAQAIAYCVSDKNCERDIGVYEDLQRYARMCNAKEGE